MSSLAGRPGGCGRSAGLGGEKPVQLARGSTCCPLPSPRPSPPGPIRRSARPAQQKAGPAGPACPKPRSPRTSCVPRREKELQGFLLPPRPARLRTAEQEAIWGGMGAVRRRQPPEDPFPPPPPSQLRQPA